MAVEVYADSVLGAHCCSVDLVHGTSDTLGGIFMKHLGVLHCVDLTNGKIENLSNLTQRIVLNSKSHHLRKRPAV